MAALALLGCCAALGEGRARAARRRRAPRSTAQAVRRTARRSRRGAHGDAACSRRRPALRERPRPTRRPRDIAAQSRQAVRAHDARWPRTCGPRATAGRASRGWRGSATAAHARRPRQRAAAARPRRAAAAATGGAARARSARDRDRARRFAAGSTPALDAAALASAGLDAAMWPHADALDRHASRHRRRRDRAHRRPAGQRRRHRQPRHRGHRRGDPRLPRGPRGRADPGRDHRQLRRRAEAPEAAGAARWHRRDRRDRADLADRAAADRPARDRRPAARGDHRDRRDRGPARRDQLVLPPRLLEPVDRALQPPAQDAGEGRLPLRPGGRAGDPRPDHRSTAKGSRPSCSSRTCRCPRARGRACWAPAIGLAATLAVGVVTFALQRKLPYRRMLIATGVLIAVVLAVMTGTTAHVLQGLGWLPEHADRLRAPAVGEPLARPVRHLRGPRAPARRAAVRSSAPTSWRASSRSRRHDAGGLERRLPLERRERGPVLEVHEVLGLGLVDQPRPAARLERLDELRVQRDHAVQLAGDRALLLARRDASSRARTRRRTSRPCLYITTPSIQARTCGPVGGERARATWPSRPCPPSSPPWRPRASFAGVLRGDHARADQPGRPGDPVERLAQLGEHGVGVAARGVVEQLGQEQREVEVEEAVGLQPLLGVRLGPDVERAQARTRAATTCSKSSIRRAAPCLASWP